MNNAVEQLTLDEKLNEVITLELWIAFMVICMFGGLL